MNEILTTSYRGQIETGDPYDTENSVRQDQFCDHGWNPRCETRDQATVVRFDEDVTTIEAPAKSSSLQIARQKEAVAARPTISLLIESSLALPEYSTKRSFPANSSLDRSILRNAQGTDSPIYAINLSEFDTMLSASIREYEKKVARAIVLARISKEEQKQSLRKMTKVFRGMRRTENAMGQPAQNVLDNSHDSSGIVAKTEAKASERLERQLDALKFRCDQELYHGRGRSHGHGVGGGSWLNRFTQWVRPRPK
ncbi:hypothetical protein E4U55_005656 [Claviceps digitariae]|nr:hypothetical protein E4U55_005656 [Claviceps digitariae]